MVFWHLVFLFLLVDSINGTVVYTPNSYSYKSLTPYGFDASKVTSFTFRVKACNDAHLALYSNSGSLWEIVIGGWGNGQSVIRNAKQGHNYVAYRGSVVSCSSYNFFWVSWTNGYVKFGKGTSVGSSQIMAWNDPSPHNVDYAAVSTGWGSTGYWEVVVNGGWSGWGSYSSCTKSCGSGSKTRYRSCNNPSPSGGGSSCSGSSSQTASCNTHSCAVHGNWGSWGSYGSCSRTCGGGTYSRSRSCNNPAPANGGNQCSGSGSQTSSCNSQNCPIDGGWTSWASWGSCTVSCGGGSKTRSRSCTNPSPAYNGANCAGSGSSSTSCNTHNCPIDGGWTNWASWGTCTVTCGGGTKVRDRSCTNPAPAYNGANCVGTGSSSTSCNTHNCPIDGGWTSWASWGSCTVSCGGGSKSRSRSCTNPSPAYNGANCAGSGSSSTSCNTHNCPIDGGWTNWASWGTCTVTCGGGTKVRDRSCTNPAPAYNGANCTGAGSSSTSCNTHNCPIDGGWGAWAAWSTCTYTCGGGTQMKSRACDSPTPQYGGAYCSGDSIAGQACNTNNCPIDGAWTGWSSWTSCPVTCGGGTQNRGRSCTNPAPAYNGANCPGSGSDSKSCNTQNCPIDGAWTAWSVWDTCTVTCGGGTQGRTRTCTAPSPQYGGANCVGSTDDSQACNTQVCIIDGNWSQWSAFGACSVSCGGGTYSRARTCSDPAPANGGLDCSGDSADFGTCNSNACPTVAAGTYQQLCPNSWFTCESGGISCIQNGFKCDCQEDCDDGSDETEGYATCPAYLLALCKSGAGTAISSGIGLVVSILAALLLAR